MVLVPMLIADQNGHRVGYGKGFYDKFLATCKPSCIPVGLCFYEPVASIDDVNALDMPLKYCVTPGSSIAFDRRRSFMRKVPAGSDNERIPVPK